MGSAENLRCTQPMLELAPSLLPVTKNVLFGITTAEKVNLGVWTLANALRLERLRKHAEEGGGGGVFDQIWKPRLLLG